MKLQESGENYLETILILKNRFGYVRAIDVANEMGFSKPSVSRAVSILKENGYIASDPNGMLLLTKEGQAVAEEIYERHQVLTHFLLSIGVNEQTAAEDACKIEHAISHESFEKLKSFITKNSI
jgi:Mn-dependent DtxR family transcriptional regulator